MDVWFHILMELIYIILFNTFFGLAELLYFNFFNLSTVSIDLISVDYLNILIAIINVHTILVFTIYSQYNCFN